MPDANTHFVLGNPLRPPFAEHLKVAVFATGCFWGSEKSFWRLPGVYSTAVGYVGGQTPSPTYEQVCSGRSGHAEAVHVVYDPVRISYADLLANFWQSHDPTQGMRQGNDAGSQYRSGIYCIEDVQQQLAERSRDAFQTVVPKKPITSEIKKIVPSEFHFAEDYHQQYLAKPGNRQYCSAQPLGLQLPDFKSWGGDLTEHAPKLPDWFWLKYGPQPGRTIAGPNEQITLS
eukprot:NODE_3727_length_927_cov_50.577449_g3427_i0.p1 GENE.NODE_3727_length_927_cov_50.577449_g3427_i0~~NODE_3727_length_927_cov_50.577449_g3427_i0.p1  ORF type:complete len:254 (-),score=44.24 NODE_3727_length_927_cov_50.577449_g3427_i0:165-854(-)